MKILILCLCASLIFLACSEDSQSETVEGECTLGKTRLFAMNFHDICFQSCQPGKAKNVKKTECGEQLGYKLEYSFYYAHEILNSDNEHCAKQGNILTCYDSIIIDEQKASILIAKDPSIYDRIDVKIKDEYVLKYMHVSPLVITYFPYPRLFSLASQEDSSQLVICHEKWLGKLAFCPAAPDYDIENDCGYFPRKEFRCGSTWGKALEYYISYGSEEEILNESNERCVKEEDRLTCYNGMIIYYDKGEIKLNVPYFVAYYDKGVVQINEPSLRSSLASHPCSNNGGVCKVMVRDSSYYASLEPLEIFKSSTAEPQP